MNPTPIDEVVRKLIELGEDREELQFWQEIYPNLDADDQRELVSLLEEELAELGGAPAPVAPATPAAN